jgi:hypothetical protein
MCIGIFKCGLWLNWWIIFRSDRDEMDCIDRVFPAKNRFEWSTFRKEKMFRLAVDRSGPPTRAHGHFGDPFRCRGAGGRPEKLLRSTFVDHSTRRSIRRRSRCRRFATIGQFVDTRRGKKWNCRGRESGPPGASRATKRKTEDDQGCQIFLDAMYQKQGKMFQITTKLPNGHTIYQMIVIYLFQMTIKYKNIFYSKALQNFPRLGFLVWK